MPVPSRSRLCLTLLLPLLGACSGHSTAAGPTPSVTLVTSSPTPSPEAVPTTPAPSASRSATTSPTATPMDSAPPPGAPPCKVAALTLTDADSLVTQQAREQVYVLRTSGPNCGLQGYPGVTLRGADGTPLAVTYSQAPGTAAPLTLSKGTSVSFSVTSPRSGTCLDAATISVLLPEVPGALTAATTARICQAKAVVSPVRRLNADS